MQEDEAKWSFLRGLRARPPGLAATDPVRRVVFAAALEQAEQFFAAAAAVGYATKPVQLFYALSQAGRAIAAARAADPWEIKGHGAAAREHREIGVTTVEPDKRRSGAIRVVAAATGSELWEGPVELAALWASLPELDPDPVLCGTAPAALRVEPDVRFAQPLPHGRGEWLPVTTPMRNGFVARGGIDLAETFPDEESLTNAVAHRLSPYPRAAGWTIAQAPVQTFTSHEGATSVTTGWFAGEPTTVWLTWIREEDGQRVITALEAITDSFDGAFYFRPAVGQGAAMPSPLITWWGLLLGLSTLARYEPVAWQNALDIDNSPIAWALERGLASALTRIPELVLDALTHEVSA